MSDAACPLCRGTDAAVAHVGEFSLAGRRIVQETRVCRSCGLTFEHAEPDQDWASLYGTVWHRAATPSAAQRALYAADGERLGPGRARRAFDIGCGAGLLLDELARRGWRTAGCDPDGSAVEVARSKGHAVVPELFTPRAEFRSELVILGDVLEHQADPLALLSLARAIVQPGGRFYLRVPDLEALDLETFGDVFGLQHRVWFTAATLRETLGVAGFEVASQGTFGRGLFALARLAEPRPWRRPPGEPERSLAFVRAASCDLHARRRRLALRLVELAGREVALYGGGEHASELLAFSPLGKIATRVVDGNPALWGRTCGGVVIEAPRSLRERPPESVVIASRAYQAEIAAELRDLRERGVEVVQLYAAAG